MHNSKQTANIFIFRLNFGWTFNHHFSNVYCIVFFNIIGWIETNDVMVLNLRILIQKNYLTSFNWCTYVISIHEIQNHKIIKIIKV